MASTRASARAAKAAKKEASPRRRQPAAGAAPRAWPYSPTKLLSRHGRSCLAVLLAYVTLSHILPYLANLTPPGVDREEVLKDADYRALAVARDCDDSCKGMSCPHGWVTTLSPDDVCKCICERLEDNKPTLWDEEQAQKKEAARKASEAAAKKREEMGDEAPSGADAAGGAAEEADGSAEPPEDAPPQQPAEAGVPLGGASGDVQGAPEW